MDIYIYIYKGEVSGSKPLTAIFAKVELVPVRM